MIELKNQYWLAKITELGAEIKNIYSIKVDNEWLFYKERNLKGAFNIKYIFNNYNI